MDKSGGSHREESNSSGFGHAPQLLFIACFSCLFMREIENITGLIIKKIIKLQLLFLCRSLHRSPAASLGVSPHPAVPQAGKTNTVAGSRRCLISSKIFFPHNDFVESYMWCLRNPFKAKIHAVSRQWRSAPQTQRQQSPDRLSDVPSCHHRVSHNHSLLEESVGVNQI